MCRNETMDHLNFILVSKYLKMGILLYILVAFYGSSLLLFIFVFYICYKYIGAIIIMNKYFDLFAKPDPKNKIKNKKVNLIYI